MNKRPGSTPGLFVYLHGHGEKPQDAAVVITSLDPHRRFEAVTPAGPIEERTGLGWFESGPSGVDAASIEDAARWLASEIESLGREPDVASDRLVFGGYSQGGAMALATLPLLSTPATLILHNAFVPEGPGFELDIPRGSVTTAYVQNSIDDDVVPPFMGDAIGDMLGTSGAAASVVRTPGGHALGSRTLTATREWLNDVDV